MSHRVSLQVQLLYVLMEPIVLVSIDKGRAHTMVEWKSGYSFSVKTVVALFYGHDSDFVKGKQANSY